jgi:hypothetical protein
MWERKQGRVLWRRETILHLMRPWWAIPWLGMTRWGVKKELLLCVLSKRGVGEGSEARHSRLCLLAESKKSGGKAQEMDGA